MSKREVPGAGIYRAAGCFSRITLYDFSQWSDKPETRRAVHFPAWVLPHHKLKWKLPICKIWIGRTSGLAGQHSQCCQRRQQHNVVEFNVFHDPSRDVLDNPCTSYAVLFELQTITVDGEVRERWRALSVEYGTYHQCGLSELFAMIYATENATRAANVWSLNAKLANDL